MTGLRRIGDACGLIAICASSERLVPVDRVAFFALRGLEERGRASLTRSAGPPRPVGNLGPSYLSVRSPQAAAALDPAVSSPSVTLRNRFARLRRAGMLRVNADLGPLASRWGRRLPSPAGRPSDSRPCSRGRHGTGRMTFRPGRGATASARLRAPSAPAATNGGLAVLRSWQTDGGTGR